MVLHQIPSNPTIPTNFQHIPQTQQIPTNHIKFHKSQQFTQILLIPNLVNLICVRFKLNYIQDITSVLQAVPTNGSLFGFIIATRTYSYNSFSHGHTAEKPFICLYVTFLCYSINRRSMQHHLPPMNCAIKI